MNSKHCRRVLSILVCVTMVLTQMAPITFADTVSAADGQQNEAAVTQDGADGSAETAEAAENTAGAADSSDADAEAPGTADDVNAVADNAGQTGSDADDKGGDSLIDTVKDAFVSLFDNEASQQDEVEEQSEELAPDTSWYVNNKSASTFEISTASQLLGLSQLVNESTKQTFSGKTIKLTDDIDLENYSWTPIGYSRRYVFKGTFDGQGHTISGLYIDADNVSSSYIGMFGYAQSATIKNFTLNGKIEFKSGNSGRIYVAPVAGNTAGATYIESINTDFVYAGHVEDFYYFGGIAGKMATGSISDCTSKGDFDLIDTESNSGSIGGIAAEISGNISNCINNGNIICKSTMPENYIGGIVAKYSESKQIVNTVNRGDIQTPLKSGNVSQLSGTCYAGGIAGSITNASVINALNTGDILISENEDSYQMNAGGITGLADKTSFENIVNKGKMTYKDYMVDENDNVAQLFTVQDWGETATFELKNLFTAENKNTSAPVIGVDSGDNGKLDDVAEAVGIVKKNGTVTAYGGHDMFYDSETYDGQLNTYVIYNADTEGTLKLWKLVDDEYQPVGTEAYAASAPAVTVSAKIEGAAEFAEGSAFKTLAGKSVQLKAEIKADENPLASNDISYQWYVSDSESLKDAEPLKGEGASGSVEGLSKEAIYTVSENENTSRYYFIKVTNKMAYTNGETSDILLVAERSADSSAINIIFGSADSEFSAAEKFESGNGYAETPYIIKTPEQLKLMSEKINSDSADDAAYKKASYRLGGNIDYKGATWIPAGGSTKDTAFEGTFDGAGYTVENIEIMSSGSYAGLFGYVNDAEIKDLTLSGVMRASDAKYAGAFAAYADGNTSFAGLTNKVTVKAENIFATGGVAGCIANLNVTVKNCVNEADITVTADYARTDIYNPSNVYAAGIAGYVSLSSNKGTYNCLNNGDITVKRIAPEGNSNVSVYMAGILCGSYAYNCVNYGKCSAVNPASYGNDIQPLVSSGIAVNSFDMSDGTVDADETANKLNEWIVDNLTTVQSLASWMKKDESSLYYPSGRMLAPVTQPEVKLTVNSGDGFKDVDSSMISVKSGTDVVLSADINVSDNVSGTSTVKYTWYKAVSANGTGKTAIESGTLSQLSETKEITVKSDSYALDYYYIEVVNEVSYAESGVAAAVCASAVSDICGITFKTGSGYEGEASSEFKGKGTSEDPYIIASPADLKFMQLQINSGAKGYCESSVYYKLQDNLSFGSNVRFIPIGTADHPFKGKFDGNGKKISDLNIEGSGMYTSLFGYTDGAVINDLTTAGVVKATDGTDAMYAGGIVAYAKSSQINNCTSEMNVTMNPGLDNSGNVYEGGIAGYISVSSISGCVNKGTVTFENETSAGTRCAGGLVGFAIGKDTSSSVSWTDRSLTNSYNTGAVKIVNTERSHGYSCAGGIIGNFTSASVINCANTGSVTEVNTAEGISIATLLGGIAAEWHGSGNGSTGYINCVSYGNVSAQSEAAEAYTGIASIKAPTSGRFVKIENCFAVASNGTDKVFGYIKDTSGSFARNADQIGSGYIDETGNVVCATFGSGTPEITENSSYVRPDELRSAMSAAGVTGKSDIYYALNGWAGNNNSDMSNNSWVMVEGSSSCLPTGDPEKSPFVAYEESDALKANISTRAYDGIKFKKDADIPAMSVSPSGAASDADGVIYAYRWYSSDEKGTEYRKLIEKSNEKSYKPENIQGIKYYSADMTAAVGDYFKTVTSNEVAVSTEADFWTGEVADIDELAGYGTEEDPYIIDTPEKLALVSALYASYYNQAPPREVEPGDDESAGKTAVPFGSAVFRVTKDIDMGGIRAFDPIGTSGTSFKGHFYGKTADGKIPSIKNLYLRSSRDTSLTDTHVALFDTINKDGVVESLNFENAKVSANVGNTSVSAVVAAYNDGTVKDITVSGTIELKGTIAGIMSSSDVGGVVAYVRTGIVSDCVNKANIYINCTDGVPDADVTTSGYAGGIAASLYASSNTVNGHGALIYNCTNVGSIIGNNTSGSGGIAGWLSKDYTATAGGTVSECHNKGNVTGYSYAGGIVGRQEYGTVTSCYNTGDIVCTKIAATAINRAYAGGIAGLAMGAEKSHITKCYNTGNITKKVSDEGYSDNVGYAAGSTGAGVEVNNCYGLANGGIEAVNDQATSEAVITDCEAVSADKLASTEIAAALGDSFYKNVSGAPVLGYEVNDSDRCTVTIKADGENDAAVYMTAGSYNITSVNAVKGASLSFGTVAATGYSITSVKNGDTVLTPSESGVYTVTADSATALTAVLAKAPAYALIINDYTGAPEGKVLVAYRFTEGSLPEGQAVYFGDSQMVHASAFDTAVFEESASSLGHADVVPDKKLDAPVATYVAFTDADSSISDVSAAISLKAADKQETVNYDPDVLADDILDVFDAQRVWDIMSGRTIASITDMQRLQADVNHDGVIDITDVLAVHDAIINKLK